MHLFKSSLIILLFSFSFSIVPPKNGKFSQELLQRFNEQEIGENYGNLGWVDKIKLNKQNLVRDAQLEFNLPVLLGRYADVSNTYFSAIDYQNLLFDQNETGTMTEYYSEISYGNFLLDGETGGWYQSYLTQNEAVNQVKSYVSNIAALADADFNYINFAGVAHSYTNPKADEIGKTFNIPNLKYNKKADDLSWLAMKHFFDRIFKLI
mgnify:CR=1 FL=1